MGVAQDTTWVSTSDVATDVSFDHHDALLEQLSSLAESILSSANGAQVLP